jgi:hypothetical protein
MDTITVTDAGLIQKLLTDGYVKLCDPTGQVIGIFTGPTFGHLPEGVRSPFTDEELERRRQDRTGRSFAEVMKDLRERA